MKSSRSIDGGPLSHLIHAKKLKKNAVWQSDTGSQCFTKNHSRFTVKMTNNTILVYFEVGTRLSYSNLLNVVFAPIQNGIVTDVYFNCT